MKLHMIESEYFNE